MQIIWGLNDQYNNVKAQVFLMEPIPPIAKNISFVVQ